MSADRCDLLCLDLPRAEAVRAALLDGEAALRAAGHARSLGDPTRLRLAAALAETEELCVCDLAWISGRSDKLVSHHLRVLRQAGLVESRRAAKVVFYRLTGLGRRLVRAELEAVS
jgi:ArsR family transcriptional regulator, lead/cadmium/zinc/bismuth-responsive transcriptional repressor